MVPGLKLIEVVSAAGARTRRRSTGSPNGAPHGSAARPMLPCDPGSSRVDRNPGTSVLRLLPLLLFAFAVAHGAPARALTLKLATLAPAGTSWMEEMNAGAKAIEARTEGRVRLKIYPGGVMGSEQSVHRKIRAGQLHGGAFSSGGLIHVYPDIACLNLPLLFEDLDEVDYVRARMDPELKRELADRGFELLGIAEGGFARILSTAPMASLDAVRASRLWAPEGDDMVITTYRSMGLSPVLLPISDVFTGLQTGLIETVTVTPTAAIAFQWHTSTGYMTDTPLMYTFGLLVLDKRVFDRIDPADRTILREEIEHTVARMDRITREDNLRAAEALANLGIVSVSPNATELAHWRKMAERAVEDLIAQGELTRPVVERVMTHLRQFRAGRQP